jgi:phage anti-repressor protein
MAAVPGFGASGYRLLTDSSGAPLLNFKFAKHFAICASIAPKGAIARVILDEGLKAAESGDTNYINHALARYGNIGLVVGLMHGRALHSFLTPNSVFEDWFAQQKQRLRLVYGRDYVRVSESGGAATNLHRKDTGKGEIYFVEATAERTIMHDPSPRGMLASEYINNPMPRRNEG